MNRRNYRALLSLPVALLLVMGLGTSGLQAASHEDGDGFRLWLDPFYFAVLETDVDTDSSKFEEYRDLGSGILIPRLNLYGESADGNRTLALRTWHLDREDARATLDYAVSGRYAFQLDYNKIPHRFGNGGSMLWTRTGPGAYEIADSVEAAIQSAIEDRFNNVSPFAVNHDFLSGLLRPLLDTANRVDLVVQRNRTRAKFDLGKLGRLAWHAEYYQENRDGTRPYGAAFGFFNVQEIPEPISYTTRDTEVGGEWNGTRGGVRFGLRHSTFENSISTVVWDNPFRAVDSTDGRAYLGPSGLSINGPNRGFADLAPDNEADLLYVSGRGRAGDWWYNGGLSWSTLTQDDPLLPYTLNTAIVGIIPHSGGQTFDPTLLSSLPVRNADTEVEILSLNASAGTTFGEDFSLTFRYRYYDYDNQSTRIEFPGYVRYHSVWEEIPRITVPYSYSRDRIGAEFGWDINDRSSLTLSYDIETWDREFRETRGTDEDIIELAYDARPTDRVSIRAAWERGDRTNDGYEVEAQELSFLEPEGINNQPLLRKYLQAARDYDDYDLQVQLFPNDQWSLTFGAGSRDESYDESVFGLQSDEITDYNFELSYVPGEQLSFYLFGHFADRESLQRARQSGGTLSTRPDNDWSALLDETTDTFGLGLDAKNDSGWSFNLEGALSDSDGAADFTTTPAGTPSEAVDFDNYEDIELVTFTARVDYQILPSCSVGAVYLFEDYTINSFNLVGIEPYLPASLLLAANDGTYQADLVALYMRYSF